MIDVGEKPPTHRTAIAEGRIIVGEKAYAMIFHRALPKGDALVLAEIAGIQGAKSASQLMPLCHPMGLDHVQVMTDFEPEQYGIRVTCVAATQAKTGVEMESLAGVNAALLTIWDLTKMVEPNLRIEGVRLQAKAGGKSGLWLNPAGVEAWICERVVSKSTKTLSGVSAAIITLSDRAAAGVYEDRAIPTAKARLESLGATVTETYVIPDDPAQLKATLVEIHRLGAAKLVITSGGTGIGPRDNTPETIMEIADCIIPGIGEQLRHYGAQFTPNSWSSRCVGATYHGLLIITLPGNPKAVCEGIDCLNKQIPHLLNTINNIKHD